MAYVSDSNLTQFWGLAKDYNKAENSRFANWQKTEKSDAVTCWPVGGTRLLPTVDFMFTEVPPASGDKGPENPSTITGVNSVKVTRCGKNLLYYPYYLSTDSANGLTFTANADGTVLINGTANQNTYFSICDVPIGDQYASDYICLVRDKNYICSLRLVAGTYSGDIYFQAMKAGSGVSCLYPALKLGSQSRFYWNNANAAEYMKYRLQVMNGAVCTNLVVAPQLEEGTEATAYESPANTTYTIDLGGTYYGGSVDLATGVMTVTWAGDVLSASNFSTVGFSQNVVTTLVFNTSRSHGGGSTTSSSVLTCNRFLTVSGSGDTEHVRFSGAGSTTALNVYIDRSRLDLSGAVDPANPTGAELKAAMIAWLEANPTLVAYQLSEPFTVTLTPTEILSLTQTDKYTPRMNTVYTDAQAVQVGYAKSPIRSEYELTQAIIATEGGE